MFEWRPSGNVMSRNHPVKQWRVIMRHCVAFGGRMKSKLWTGRDAKRSLPKLRCYSRICLGRRAEELRKTSRDIRWSTWNGTGRFSKVKPCRLSEHVCTLSFSNGNTDTCYYPLSAPSPLYSPCRNTHVMTPNVPSYEMTAVTYKTLWHCGILPWCWCRQVYLTSFCSPILAVFLSFF
jgi:hypothetical protein